MKRTISVSFFLICFFGISQSDQDKLLEDTHYLEDQFYLSMTYNFLLEKPSNVSQRNLSYGIQAGFIKDIPLNEKRTIAVGIGLGYGGYSYYTNLQAFEVNGGFTYQVLDSDSTIKRNKIETHIVELPIEFRIRNSTPTSYKFMRLHLGAKLGYVVAARSKTVFENYKDSFYNSDVSGFQYGITFNLGYDTFNLHIYYALNNLFDGPTTAMGEKIKFKPLRVGLIFYFL